MRYTVRYADASELPAKTEIAIRWLLGRGYKRIRLGNPVRMDHGVYITVAGIK